MSIRRIPEQTITVCDCCGRDVGTPGVTRSDNGKITISHAVRDHLGSIVGGANEVVELCDACFNPMLHTIEELRKGLRELHNPKPKL